MRLFGCGVAAVVGSLGLLSAAPAVTAGPARPTGAHHPALFRVGAAVETINPTYRVFLGGYGPGPAAGTISRHVNPLTGRPEDLTVRAVSIEAAGKVVELASIDSQGYEAGYQEGPYGITDIRKAVAAFLRAHQVAGADPADIIVSSLHEHAVPTVYGIWAPPAHDLAYLKQVAAATTRALEEAYERAVPATITAGQADAPWLAGGDVAEGNEFEGWKRDGSLVALWARDLHGATIATYVSEPAYPNIVYGQADLVGGAGRATLISGDFPAYAEAIIEQRLGGIAVLASGSLANQASPMQADIAPSPDLPKVGGLAPTRAFDDIIHMGRAVAAVTFGALAGGAPITHGVVDGAEQHVVSPITNPALVAVGYGDAGDGAAWAPLGELTTIYPSDRANTPPYAYGGALGTWVTALRIGDIALLSEPGEFFGSIRQAWAEGIHAAGGVFVVGAAQDFLGYEYPVYVTPFTALGGDEHIFGPAPTLGDQVMTQGDLAAAQLGFGVDLTSSPELTALDQQYQRVSSTGAVLVPATLAADIDASAGSAMVTALAAADPPRTTMACDNPALLFTPPGCSVPDPAPGPFHWRFGDGTTATTPVQGTARASFSPFVQHGYRRPGTYRLAVAVTAAGSTDTVALPVRIFPPLHPAIVRTCHGAAGVVTGGDGHLLVERWTLADGRTSYGRAPDGPAPGPISLTVVDGTGGTATTTSAAGPPACGLRAASIGEPTGADGRLPRQDSPAAAASLHLGAGRGLAAALTDPAAAVAAAGAAVLGAVLGAVLVAVSGGRRRQRRGGA